MLTSHRRRCAGSRALTTSLALAASVALATAPVASAQSTAQADGTIAVGSLGSTTDAPGSTTGSLGPFGSLASPAYAEYVALGDSYSAFGDQTEKAGFTPAECLQSLSNYPKVLNANPAIGELTDVTCGGATVPDLTEEQTFQDSTETAAPQFDALSADTDLITLSIGGNDIGFGEIVACLLRAATLPSVDCEDEMGADVSAAIATTFAEDGPVDGVYDAIAAKAPGSTVVTTQYLPLMPADDADAVGCDLATGIGQANLDWAREITAEMNDAVTAAAERNGHAAVLPTSDIDRSGCADADKRWTDFTGGAPTNAAPFHPTALGQQAMAAAIAAEL